MGLGLVGKHIKEIRFRVLQGELNLRNSGDLMGNILLRFYGKQKKYFCGDFGLRNNGDLCEKV